MNRYVMSIGRLHETHETVRCDIHVVRRFVMDDLPWRSEERDNIPTVAAECLRWLEDEGIDHHLHVERHPVEVANGEGDPWEGMLTHVVYLHVPDDNVAFWLRMKFGALPLPEGLSGPTLTDMKSRGKLKDHWIW